MVVLCQLILTAFFLATGSCCASSSARGVFGLARLLLTGLSRPDELDDDELDDDELDDDELDDDELGDDKLGDDGVSSANSSAKFRSCKLSKSAEAGSHSIVMKRVHSTPSPPPPPSCGIADATASARNQLF